MHSAPSPFAIHAPVPKRVRASATPTRLNMESRPSAIPPPVLSFERVRTRLFVFTPHFHSSRVLSFQTTPRSSSSKEPKEVAYCLLSPPRISERRARPPCPVSTSRHPKPPRVSKTRLPSQSSPTPQCTTTRRRRSAYTTRSTGRSRHCRLSDCKIVSSSPAMFDKIPWISMLEEKPDEDRLIPLSLADLSPRICEKDDAAISGPGPIRSRKSSLRTAPFPTDLAQLATPELVPSSTFDSPLTELPFSLDSPLPTDDDVLKTPPMRASVLPVDAGFHHLMPLAFADLHADETWWQKEPPSP